jgi:hypothetical protein
MRLSLLIVLAAFLCVVMTPFVSFFLMMSVGVATGYSLDFGYTMLAVFIFMMVVSIAGAAAKKQ